MTLAGHSKPSKLWNLAVFNAFCLILSGVLIWQKPRYDWIGQNFPLNMQLKLGKTTTTFAESTRYPDISSNVSSGMWLTQFPAGAGYTHLGPDYRAFYTSMWHELHCLRVIHLLLEDPDDDSFGGEGHLQHCLNYLRQYVLCGADDTLEPGDYKVMEERGEDVIFERECMDWQKIFDFNNRNEEAFRKDQLGRMTSAT